MPELNKLVSKWVIYNDCKASTVETAKLWLKNVEPLVVIKDEPNPINETKKARILEVKKIKAKRGL
tara:strand:+ start:160 stop:357 length:198 start_codon:yes stop_codon:yes gene_type:complete